jgi:hypothetical protein
MKVSVRVFLLLPGFSEWGVGYLPFDFTDHDPALAIQQCLDRVYAQCGRQNAVPSRRRAPALDMPQDTYSGFKASLFPYLLSYPETFAGLFAFRDYHDGTPFAPPETLL